MSSNDSHDNESVQTQVHSLPVSDDEYSSVTDSSRDPSICTVCNFVMDPNGHCLCQHEWSTDAQVERAERRELSEYLEERRRQTHHEEIAETRGDRVTPYGVTELFCNEILSPDDVPCPTPMASNEWPHPPPPPVIPLRRQAHLNYRYNLRSNKNKNKKD